MDGGNDFKELKQSFEDVISAFSLKGKTHTQLVKNGSYKREQLAEALVKVMEICDKTMTMYENEVSSPITADTIVPKVQDAIGNMVPTLVSEIMKNSVHTNNKEIGHSSSIVSSKTDMERHVIVIKEKEDGSKFNEHTWAGVVKGTLQTELQNIPVNKSLLSKDGHGCLFFPNKKAQAEAKLALEPLFEVTTDSRPKKRVMPKIKVFDIDTEIYSDKPILKQAILHKNPEIAEIISNDDDFGIILIDTSNRYAILKVSPNIRKAMISRGKIYLGMQSLRVRDHFQPLQCFTCQEHGHKQGSTDCKLVGKEVNICLYCSGNHFSRDCTVKKKSDQHVCSNCKHSSNSEHKRNSSHKSTSFRCPFVIKEVNSLIQRTTGISDIEAKKLKIPIH